MQVKKFEARTMKDALEMVKVQLGPEAIILAVRDNKRSFGLVGEGSVEITAAVSENSLRKMKFAEGKLLNEDREKMKKSPAREQKSIIESFVQKEVARRSEGNKQQITQKRYIEIDQEVQAEASPSGVPEPEQSPAIQVLRDEIKSLKEVIKQFKLNQKGEGENSGEKVRFFPTFPGFELGVSQEHSEIFRRMTQSGVLESHAFEVIKSVLENTPAIKYKNESFIEGSCAKVILESSAVIGLRPEDKVHLFWGNTASGRTSSLVKLASRLIVKDKKRIGILTLETNKVGAAEQLRIYSQILNVPFALVRGPEDWEKVQSASRHLDFILVDTPSFGRPTATSWIPKIPGLRNHLVVSAKGQIESLDKILEVMKTHKVNPQDLIVNFLDQCRARGGVYSLQRELKIPLFAFGTGPRIPDDFEFATPERVLDLIFKITESKTMEDRSL